MRVLLYLEAEKYLSKSGIGRAIKHQARALSLVGQDYTTNPDDNYDLVHINTYGINSWLLMKKAKRLGKKVIMHGHSTEEDFRNSFIFSNTISPLFKKYLCLFYKNADAIITPTEYSKSLIESYGIKQPIFPISNGIDLRHYGANPDKEAAFRDYFKIEKGQKVVIGAGLYFLRKGIDDFVRVAQKMPDVRFIWFGETNKWIIPAEVRQLVEHNHPQNLLFPGYIKGDVYEGAMTAADAFFFPSREETEGIVVLEALASKQNILVRDIPVYSGWIDQECAELASDVDGFVEGLERIFSGQVDKTQKGYQVAESRSIEKVAAQLVAAYQKVMEL
ncbi:glycosyltransferase family 4 protein [Streptococcus parauberis]|uniref:Glycosyltransferase n=3 Tax=Streptococcus parauberis TaxID=1348 RepID=A0A0E2U9C1_9STRE|nr:glycosyltransferase [Streptococcus parauberis]AEF24791.1 glycosyltransferase [Streptococcus parauberis KCTC 11537]AUT05558.1 Diglucosyl diacylglycerol synthase (1,2-linking) [Streptococcus parauberis]EGE54172.1 glycosyltransferase, group 1 family protein [Streptococcus parauberis NCFD 2020]EMG26422.1 Glycosyltransferase LafB, responsible for the formation of Gal-Glc-DAG [Streptococcus parauberis KRS-02083]KYP17580.1 Processive diacylglycerol alpha-glucosyltransferase [Streptococcus parauber